MNIRSALADGNEATSKDACCFTGAVGLCRQVVRIAAVVVGLLAGLNGATALAESPVKTAAEEKQFVEILGSPLADWNFSRRDGAEFDHRLLKTSDGRNVLAAGPFATILDHKTPLANDSELLITLRLAHPQHKEVWFWLMLGHHEPAKYYESPYGMSFRLPAGDEQELFHWTVRRGPGRGDPVQGASSSRALPAGREAWPQMVRARVERNHASLPPLAQRWLTIRVVLRRGSVQYYLDDRLLFEAAGAKVDATGLLNMTLFDGVQLHSIRTRDLPPDDPRFAFVPLGSDLNSAEIAGTPIDAAKLPPPGKPVLVDGVPFVLPAADAAGRNHIDLKPSWLPGGALEGPFDGLEGDLARWRGAVYRDAGRFQFRVRNARYAKLHLLAAYSDEPDTTPIVTAQFFRSDAGHPVEFSTRVPSLTANATNNDAVSIELRGGAKGALHVVTIPLEPEGLASFADLDHLEFELTKATRIHRSFPDPIYYSRHAAGLPSGVHVFAITLERPAVDVELQPEQFAHIWTAPEQASYTIRLKNRTVQEREVHVELATVSHDGTDKSTREQRVKVRANGETTLRMPLALKRYGYHQVQLRVKDDEGERVQTRSLAHLHPDTRERGGWQEGRGPLFGFWDWNGGHVTPGGPPRLEVMVRAGAESSMMPLVTGQQPGVPYTAEELALARQHKMTTHFLAYQLHMIKEHIGVDFDAKKPDEMRSAIVAALKKAPLARPTDTNRPELAVFWAEPLLGPVSYRSLPEYYGDPPYKMTAAEQAAFKQFNDEFVIAASAIKQQWPRAKCLMPWGISSFPIPFLRHSPEATELMDGPAVDQVLFERMPEMQMHQVTFASTLWQLKQEWLKTGKPWPKLTTVEGGGLTSPATPGALTEQQEADHSIRGELLLAAFGVTHYGGGMCQRQPLLSPKPFYSAYATMTRQLNRMNFVKVVPTPSNSVFCLQFKHYKTGRLLHVFWTLRGKRPLSLAVPADGKIAMFDQMDNETELKPTVGRVTLTASTSPCYVRGLGDGAEISLGVPDHSDSMPAADALRIGNLGDGTWKMSTERDEDYENAHPEFVKKFPGAMSIQPVDAPNEAGGKALAVHLEPQEKERRTMPFYTTLVPAAPIPIAGKPSHLGLWVRASSDWGRVVYCLRDAKGERWISVGQKGEWNVDDVHCWSAFNFDGWRYLRFEMPGNAPYDLFREAGTSFWGYYGTGDGVVDLPLSMEKIIVERRTHVIKADELLPAAPDDVLLGDLYSEYERPVDNTDESVRLSRLKMPIEPERKSVRSTAVTAGPLEFAESLIRDKYGYAYGLSAVDIDRDGDLDLTSADATKDFLYWFENDGQANFTPRLICEKDPLLFERHAAGDIDRDGWPDVAIVKNLAAELLWFQNSAHPRDGKLWKRYVVTKEFSNAYDVALADFDGDGDLDIAASSYQGNEFAWFVNNGTPQDAKLWVKHLIDAGISDTRTIAAADFNADGRLDVLGTGLIANLVVWYEAHGEPGKLQWRKHIIDNKSFGPCHGHPVDMDGDGDMDIIMALGYAAQEATDTHHAAWYENVGAPGKGVEWKKHVIGSHFAAFEAIAVDLDGDKDLDVVATAMGSVGGVVWFENTGDPRKAWLPHPLKPAWPNANQIIAADFNGDGRPDLAGSAERGSNEVILWRNLGLTKGKP